MSVTLQLTGQGINRLLVLLKFTGMTSVINDCTFHNGRSGFGSLNFKQSLASQYSLIYLFLHKILKCHPGQYTGCYCVVASIIKTHAEC